MSYSRSVIVAVATIFPILTLLTLPSLGNADSRNYALRYVFFFLKLSFPFGELEWLLVKPWIGEPRTDAEIKSSLFIAVNHKTASRGFFFNALLWKQLHFFFF